MKERGIFLVVIVLVVFNSMGISAACNGDDNQSIMRLYKDSNSHGATWDCGGSANCNDYAIEICYNDVNLFGMNYAGQNPHDCDGDPLTNKVIGLYSAFNSHAEKPSLDAYPVDVCYGDLDCRIVDVGLGESCDGTREKIVVSLSSDSNSHIAKGDFAGYDKKVCCASGEELTDIYWASSGDTETRDENAIEGENMNLVLKGDFTEREIISYEIWEEDKNECGIVGCAPDKANAIFADYGITAQDVLSGKIVLPSTPWPAERQCDGIGILGCQWGNPEYYFEIQINGGEVYDSRSYGSGEGDADGLLIVSLASGDNEPPEPKIETPVHGQIYFVGKDIEFFHSTTDPDNAVVNLKWEFGGGVKIGENEPTQSKILTGEAMGQPLLAKYSSSGKKTVTLTATDSEGATGTDSVSILVIDPTSDDYYIFANISSPQEKVSTNDGDILMNSSGSYVIQTSFDTSLSIDCILGFCPETTSTSSPVNIGGSKTNPLNSPDLNFKWQMSEGDDFEGRGDTASITSFERFFAPGNQWVELELSYYNQETQLASSGTRKEFVVNYNQNTCSADGAKWYSGGGVNPSMENCEINGETCCPLGYDCKLDVCVSTNTFLCAHYETEDNCQDYNKLVAKNSVKLKREDGKTCPETIKYSASYYEYLADCRCEWDVPGDKNGNCAAKYVVQKKEIGGDDVANFGGVCTYIEDIDDDCSDGLLQYSWTAIWTHENGGPESDPSCIDQSEIVPCPVQTRLGFFGFFQFLVSLIIISIIYYSGIKND